MPIAVMQNDKCNLSMKHVFLKKHCHKAVSVAMHFHHHLIHSGELIVILMATVIGFIFAWSGSLPNNTSLEYPLQRVSTLECRATARDVMTGTNCKINLPIIEDANYEKYENKKTYRDIYTALRWAPYNDTWNQYSGAHDWVDMATAKWTPLYSIWEGKIFYAWRQDGYGNVVKIEYIVDGEHVFAVYWHMDTMDVVKWDIVKKWQKIWTVWNSGNTFWALWWYHVHFEIAKDNGGRPMYAFLWCSDLKKWTYQIIMNGLCRNELVNHSYDPIEFIEKYKDIAKPAERTTSTWKTTNVTIDGWQNDKIIINEKIALNEDIKPKVEIETKPKVEIEVKQKIETTETPIKVEVKKNDSEIITWWNKSGENLIEFDISKTSEWIKHFLNQWDIRLELSGYNRVIKIGEELNLDINVYSKKDWSRFVGLLKYALGFITTNKNIETDMVNVQLIKSIWTKLVIKGMKTWKTTIIINLGWEKIWKLEIEVK